jgi:5-methylcytosine-specific restriction protein B
MNTADRSLALVDYALRRRFAFAWLNPAFNDRLRAFLATRPVSNDLIDKIFARVNKLNAAIEADNRNLGRGYLVGHSYFCQEDPSSEYGAKWYERLVRYEIRPLLEEYFAEDLEKVDKLTMELLG